MKTKQVIFHYAHTNKSAANKLIDDSDKEQGIIKLFDSESDTQPIRVKFFPNYIKNFGFETACRIEIDNYSGIVANILEKTSHAGYELKGVGSGEYYSFSPHSINNVVTYDSNKGYYLKYSVLNTDPRSQPPIFRSQNGGYTHGYTEAPVISPDSFGYIQGDFKGNITQTLSPLCTIFQKKLAYVEDYQNGKLKIQTSIYDKNGYTMQLSPILINEIIDNTKSTPLQEKQESIKQEISQLSQAMIILSNDFRATFITQELITLNNKSLQITDHFQEFTNILGLTTQENVVNLLGTENITDVHYQT
jgi:hypothetical protein